jgi:hypothetical protein
MPSLRLSRLFVLNFSPYEALFWHGVHQFYTCFGPHGRLRCPTLADTQSVFSPLRCRRYPNLRPGGRANTSCWNCRLWRSSRFTNCVCPWKSHARPLAFAKIPHCHVELLPFGGVPRFNVLSALVGQPGIEPGYVFHFFPCDVLHSRQFATPTMRSSGVFPSHRCPIYRSLPAVKP